MAGLIALVRKAANTPDREKALKAAGGAYSQVRPVAWGRGAGYSHDAYSFPELGEDEHDKALETLKTIVKDDGAVLDGTEFESDGDTLASVGLQEK